MPTQPSQKTKTSERLKHRLKSGWNVVLLISIIYTTVMAELFVAIWTFSQIWPLELNFECLKTAEVYTEILIEVGKAPPLKLEELERMAPSLKIAIVPLFPSNTNGKKIGILNIPLPVSDRTLFQRGDRSPGSLFNSICLTGKSYAFIIKPMWNFYE